MALLNPIILWPVRFAATTYVLRVTCNGVAEDLNFPASGALTVGRNYYLSGDGAGDSDGGEGGVGDVLKILELCLESHSEAPTVTVAFDSSMRIVVTSSKATTIHFSHVNTTLSYFIFGAENGNEATSSGTVTFDRRAYGHWRPRQPWNEDSRERTEISTGVSTSLSGKVYRSRLTDMNKPRMLSWSVLNQARVLMEYGDDSGGSSVTHDMSQTDTFEYMWRAALSYGWPIRIYEDDTDLSSDYGLYLCDDKNETWQRDQQYILLWKATLSLRKYAAQSASVSAGVYEPPMFSLLPRSEMAGTREPTSADDASRGYSYGSRWLYDSIEWVLTTGGWKKTAGARITLTDDRLTPVARYMLQGTLADSGPNSYTALTVNGTARWTRIFDQIAFYGDGGTNLTAAVAGLRLTGAVSMECRLQLISSPTTDKFLFGCAGIEINETADENILYSLIFVAGGFGDRLMWFHEASGAIDQTLDSSINLMSGHLYHIIATRSSSNVVKIYVNGSIVATSGPLSVAAGGASAQVSLLGKTSYWGSLNAAMYGAQIYDKELTSDEVDSLYNYVSGR